jgi:hypothetical protein
MDRPSNPLAASAPPRQGTQAQIDLELLVEKVYQLMLAELRLERARGVGASRPGKRRHG